MYAADFDYYRAGSVAEAQRLLAEHPGAKLLAGGHSLIPLLKLRLTAPSAVIDIGRIAELRGIKGADGGLRIGALTTHAEIAGSELVRKACPTLAEAAAHIGDPAVRNRGTIGGNVAHADPGSDLPTVLTVLGASMIVAGAGGATRTVAAADFFQGLMTTAIADGEVLVAVTVPNPTAGQRAGYAKFSHPASRYAVVSAGALVTIAGGVCTSARVAVGGLVPSPLRLGAVETALTGQRPDPPAIAAASAHASDAIGDRAIGDVFASAEYRRAVAPVWVGRALTQAVQRAG
jgi:aerobic carbon-monoxide dehydrogenase medium subunit